MFEVHVRGTFFATQAVLPQMQSPQLQLCLLRHLIAKVCRPLCTTPVHTRWVFAGVGAVGLRSSQAGPLHIAAASLEARALREHLLFGPAVVVEQLSQCICALDRCFVLLQFSSQLSLLLQVVALGVKAL